ncbi:dTDP-4-dehydrorhamnose reductase [Gimibacter soli]|uniref:dTDP-4-dehydrorhamnose reductase n=1 Tax=Gimibacter soli TaxID=3024400 RepID=A0AAE9XUX5_9PROT|nr:dTDP-4-dehydrorhamnose reductase [Gimibacter soli]WCL55130.1 dTDP-4-dehydrorhamnose reductase [Gimibacter soli]
MRILVAGKSGQVALALEELAKGREDLTLETFGRPDFDLKSPTSMDAAVAAFRPDAIINAAAYTAVDAAETDEDEATAINADGAAALAAIAHARGLPFLHISTDYVFDGTKDAPYVETDPTGPTGAYGRSKLAGEQAVMQVNPDALVFRTAWVYSPWGKNFLKTMLKLGATRDTLGVVADQVGNPTYAPDIAAALVAVLEKGTEGKAGIYHLAGTGSISWHGFATRIFEAGEHIAGQKAPTVNAITTADYPTPAKRPANSRLDCGKLETVFSVRLPAWEASTDACVKRLVETGEVG